MVDYSSLSIKELLKLAKEAKIELKKEEIKINSDDFINGVIHGDSLEVLKGCPDNHFDSVVTDPPYGLSFMGKKWDYDVPSVELWKEVLRVLKPGGHLLSFAGSRTYHRMAVNVEDAGFEIRDQIMWVYGSGFPKSHNIGKAVDKLQGNEREYVETVKKLHISTNNTNDGWKRPSHYNEDGTPKTEMIITKGNSEWEGWGTALKPAHEPIVVARKLLSEKTVAKNVVKYGTGGINIDVCRILPNENDKQNYGRDKDIDYMPESPALGKFKKNKAYNRPEQGRFPANIILDEEAGKMLDEQSGISNGDNPNRKPRGNAPTDGVTQFGTSQNPKPNRSDKGGASRFFYCPKASKAERNKGCEALDKQERIRQDLAGEKNNTFSSNFHPTVKPIKLMEYLIKLVTPPGGIILDPFMGSGTTLVSAKNLGFNAVGIERDAEYIKIAKARINNED